jgi:hypothetical protein
VARSGTGGHTNALDLGAVVAGGTVDMAGGAKVVVVVVAVVALEID